MNEVLDECCFAYDFNTFEAHVCPSTMLAKQTVYVDQSISMVVTSVLHRAL